MHAPTCQQNVLKLATEAIDFLARFECKRKIRIQYVGVKYSTHDVCDVTFSSTCSLLFWRCDMDKTSVGYNYEILCETWEKHRDNKHFHTNNAYRPMLQEAQRRHFAAEQLGLHMRFIWWIYSWVMTTTKIGQRNFWWLFHHSRRHTVYFPLRLFEFLCRLFIFSAVTTSIVLTGSGLLRSRAVAI